MLHTKIRSQGKGGRGGGWNSPRVLRVCGSLPKTLALFIAKIRDFQYPSYDLILNQYGNPVSELPYA